MKSRSGTNPLPTSASTNTTNTSADMKRLRAASARSGPTASADVGPPPTQSQSSTTESTPGDAGPTNEATPSKDAALPMIRFIPHSESRSSRPSLHFTAVARTLKQPHSVVRVGRYSERDINIVSPDSPILPVGFKSKVVSRRHCEFWCSNGQWYVKDVKSSSGTFLNHVRLSSPGQESRPFPVNDGDVVQLGIDFKGGEEVIFRCVKIRIECNRGWQKSLNNFNTSAHKRILNNNQAGGSEATATGSSECSICLNPVAPCQALFVAPCSHVWHYKCIRNLIEGRNSPNFMCPNCRFVADLDADVEPPEEWEESVADEMDEAGGAEEDAGPEEMEMDAPNDDEWDEARQNDMTEDREEGGARERIPDEELSELMSTTTLHAQNQSTERTTTDATTQPMDINANRSSSAELLGPRSATPTSNAQFALAAVVMNMPAPSGDGPPTPRNHAGPFVFDGNDRESRESGGV